MFDRDGYRCRTCGKAGRLNCDHVKRIEDGGAVYDPGKSPDPLHWLSRFEIESGADATQPGG